MTRLVMCVAIVVGACGGGGKGGDGNNGPADANVNPVDSSVDGATAIDAAPADAGTDAPIVLVDAATSDAPTASSCNPLTQTGCGAGEKCGWFDDGVAGYLACVPNGAIVVGQACTLTGGATGYSDCASGSECVSGTCKSICDPEGGAPMCDANHSCSRYAGLFEVGGVSTAGVCDPKCDPLTQAKLVGANATACGSTNASMPNAGCYTFDFHSFTCAPVASTSLTLTDRQPAAGPPAGGAYVNGCAPGFVPFFVEATGSTTVICAGLCAPLKTDSAMPQNNKGDATALAKLPSESAPAAGNATCAIGKKGSVDPENCVYVWPFIMDNGVLSTSPYNDTLGVCFAYGYYTYDHDFDVGTPNRPVPGCETLPPRVPTPPNCTCAADGTCSGTGCPDGLAHEWGCYPTTDSFFTSPTAPIRSRIRDFRVGYGAGIGRPHIVE